MITGRQAINTIERRMLALPTRLGEFGIVNLSEVADQSYRSSMKVTETPQICTKEKVDEVEIDGEMNRLAKKVKKDNSEIQQSNEERVHKEVSGNVRKTLSLAKQKRSHDPC